MQLKKHLQMRSSRSRRSSGSSPQQEVLCNRQHTCRGQAVTPAAAAARSSGSSRRKRASYALLHLVDHLPGRNSCTGSGSSSQLASKRGIPSGQRAEGGVLFPPLLTSSCCCGAPRWQRQYNAAIQRPHFTGCQLAAAGGVCQEGVWCNLCLRRLQFNRVSDLTGSWCWCWCVTSLWCVVVTHGVCVFAVCAYCRQGSGMVPVPRSGTQKCDAGAPHTW